MIGLKLELIMMNSTALSTLKNLTLVSSFISILACEKDPNILIEASKEEALIEEIELTETDDDQPNLIEDSLKVLGPMSPITTMPYASIPQTEYRIDITEWDIPNDRSNPIKTTDNLQAAIDWAVSKNYGIIRLPKGHYLIGKEWNSIYQGGIELKSNMAFLLDKEAIIEMAPNDKWNYCAIAVTEKANVVISGGTIRGDRYQHTYTPDSVTGMVAHDEGNLICIQNESEFVPVQNTVIEKANGDAILLVGQKGAGSSVKNITIVHNNLNDNRRQGISIVGGERIVIEYNEIHHTNGISPQFGIDIESLHYTSKDIRIRDNYFHHNHGGDIVNTDGKNVLVDQNTFEQGASNTYIDGPLVYHKKGDWTITNNSIQMDSPSVNGFNGIILYTDGKELSTTGKTTISNNKCDNCGFYISYSSNLTVKNNMLTDGHMVFQSITNLSLEKNEVTNIDECWAFRFLETSGSAVGNMYNGTDKLIPLSATPWDGCWIR